MACTHCGCSEAFWEFDGEPIRKMRKCANMQCRLPMPDESTAPEPAAMPKAAAVLPDVPPAAPAPSNGHAKPPPLPRPAPRAPAGAIVIEQTDYVAAMREELAALDVAQRQIAARRAYLGRLLSVVDPAREDVAVEPLN